MNEDKHNLPVAIAVRTALRSTRTSTFGGVGHFKRQTHWGNSLDRTPANGEMSWLLMLTFDAKLYNAIATVACDGSLIKLNISAISICRVSADCGCTPSSGGDTVGQHQYLLYLNPNYSLQYTWSQLFRDRCSRGTQLTWLHNAERAALKGSPQSSVDVTA